MGGPRLLLDEHGRKRCPTCKEYKVLADYYPAPGRAYGVSSHCKECLTKKKRGNYSFEKGRAEHLLYVYRITPQAYERLYQQQAGVCAACGQPERRRAGRTKRTENVSPSLHIDHGHKTGAVRGLLCSGCNTALGSLGEDPERIKALLKYVEERVMPHG